MFSVCGFEARDRHVSNWFVWNFHTKKGWNGENRQKSHPETLRLSQQGWQWRYALWKEHFAFLFKRYGFFYWLLVHSVYGSIFELVLYSSCHSQQLISNLFINEQSIIQLIYTFLIGCNNHKTFSNYDFITKWFNF